jgi:competence protein ComFC
MRFLDTIWDIIFPIKCLSCGQTGEELCIKCVIESPTAERESAKWIFPIFDYRHPPIKKALWLLKYKGKKRLARIFAEILYERILEELADLSIMENFSDVILVPIPLSGQRHRERGYNQAELICKELVKIDSRRQGENKKPNFTLVKNVLIKPKETKHQALIENRVERLKNIVGSFTVQNRKHIENKNIILIDDITTTGATLCEARKILKQSGARKIVAFTVAH